MSELLLTGISGSHPLGALAAFGLLRCCTEFDVLGGAWLSWRRRADWTPILHTGTIATAASLVELLTSRQAGRASAPALGFADDIKMSPDEYVGVLARAREEASRDNRETCDFLAAFASEVITARSTGDVKPTAFHMTAGQQKFVKSARELALSLDATHPVGRRQRAEEIRAECEAAFGEALFGPWQYRDPYHSLGWDPATESLYALSPIAPTTAGPCSVRAAVWLAFEALPLFPCAAMSGRLATTGFDAGSHTFFWPVWTPPIRLDTLRSLLASADLTSGPSGLVRLRARGIAEVFCSRRETDANGRGTLRNGMPVEPAGARRQVS